MHFYTIGYGGRRPEDFFNILQEKGIKTLVDVRLRPDKAYTSFYKKAKTSDKGIEILLAPSGIKYLSMVELGNIFSDSPDWEKRYRELLSKAGDLLTERIKRNQEPFCLMCAEKLPQECHKSLIAEYLITKGHDLIEHIV